MLLEKLKSFVDKRHQADPVRLQLWICGFRSQLLSVWQVWLLVFHPLVLALSFGSGLVIFWSVGFFFIPLLLNILGAFSITLVLLAARALKGETKILVPTLLANAFFATIVFSIVFEFFVYFSPDLESSRYWIIPVWVGAYVIFAEPIYYLMFRFVVPVLLRGPSPTVVTTEEEPEDVVHDFQAMTIPSKHIVLGDRTVNQTEINLLEAQANYLVVATQTKETTEREKISTAVDEIDPNLGFQPHRSFWVAYNAIDHFVKMKGHVTLVLKDGRRVKVARSRAAEVLKIIRDRGFEQR